MKEKPVFKNRMGQFDILKGIMILMIVLIHVVSSWNHEAGVIVERKAAFFMGCFFFIAGYSQKKAKTGKFLRTQAKELMVPCLIVAATGVFCYAVKALLKGEPFSEKVLPCFLTAILSPDANDTSLLPFELLYPGSNWFLWTLFWSSLLLNEILKIREEKYQILTVAAIGITGVLLRNLPVWFYQVPQALSALPILFLGHLWNRHKLFGFRPKKWIYALLGILSLLAVIFCNADMCKNFWEYDFLSYFGLILTSILVCTLFVRITVKPGKLADWITLAGRYSLWIFLINGVDFAAFQFNNIINRIMDNAVLGFFLHLIWSFGIVIAGSILIRRLQDRALRRKTEQ